MADGLTLAITMGDPLGIGPEVVLKALDHGLPDGVGALLVGSASVLGAEARSLGLTPPPTVSDPADAPPVAVLDLRNYSPRPDAPRGPDPNAGRAAVDYIETAVQLVLDQRADAIVTGPISKEAIQAAGSPFPGHTEMLASLTGTLHPLMLMLGGRLRVALVTTHMALAEVPGAVHPDAIVETARILDDGLRRYWAVERPRVALCGLNPHCGDGGRFGDEEARVLAPAVARASELGVGLEGPFPADSLFSRAAGGEFDAVIALYHDQGLIPVKLAGLSRVVNVTLGLPVIRTSVGHGTAFGIAGTGRADEGSMVAAIGTAVAMARAVHGHRA